MPIGKCIGREIDMDRFTVLEKYRDGEFTMRPCEFVAIKKSNNPDAPPSLLLLCIACPGCGVLSFCEHGTGKRILTEHPDGSYSAHPSLIFNCCGWHGHLTMDVFTT